MIDEVQGDITTATVDAIVNAANSSLLGGGGVDAAIHKAAGTALMLACFALPHINGVRCKTGSAKITIAGNLPAKYVIHTVGPVYSRSKNPRHELENCYRSCLHLALQHHCKSIAFPAISTGVYGYPKEEARQIAFSSCEPFENDIKIIFYYL